MLNKRIFRKAHLVFFSFVAVAVAVFVGKVPFFKGLESLFLVPYAKADAPSALLGSAYDGGCCNCGVGGEGEGEGEGEGGDSGDGDY